MTPSSRRFSAVNAMRWRSAVRGVADPSLTRVGPIDSRQQASELGAARPPEPGEPDYLAAVQLQLGRLEHAASAEILGTKNGEARRLPSMHDAF